MQAIIQDLNIKLVRSRISGVNSTEINSASSFVLLVLLEENRPIQECARQIQRFKSGKIPQVCLMC